MDNAGRPSLQEETSGGDTGWGKERGRKGETWVALGCEFPEDSRECMPEMAQVKVPELDSWNLW